MRRAVEIHESLIQRTLATEAPAATILIRVMLHEARAVFRHTWIDSNGHNCVRFADYETEPMCGTRGDQYQKAYFGPSCYLYGHKLKAHSGLQYLSKRGETRNGGDFEGLAWTIIRRIGW